MAHEELEQQIESLATELSTVKGVFDDLKRAHEKDKQKAAWELSTKTQMALTATMILTMRIGQFDPKQRPPDLASVISDLETCWREAKDSAASLLKNVSSISVNLIRLHDTKVVLWHRSAEMLQKQLKKRLDGSHEALQREKSRLHTLNLQCMISQKKLTALEARSPEAQQRLDDLNKWLWNSPETRLLQQSFKIVIESLKKDIEAAKKNAESTTRALEDSQTAVGAEEANVRRLAAASKAQLDLLTQGVALLDSSTALLEEIRGMQQETARVKKDRWAAWELAVHMFDQTRHGELTLEKREYARLVLRIVEAVLGDGSLHVTLGGIVQHLAEHDDGSVRGVVGGNRGEESLLRCVQGRLGIPEEEEEEEAPVRAMEVQQEEGAAAATNEQQKEDDEDTRDGDSDSDWDKVSVPFKPYGDFDRSSIRISLTTKDAFPLADAGPPPCRDKDGSPVYLASAVGVRGGKHPCKYVPSLQPEGCRVSYGGEELRHAGAYEVLPYMPELMEFADARDGLLPGGRRGVVGGEEGGEELYHAIAEVEGVWVPGKTGRHIHGATVAYGDAEHHSTSYKVLQVAPRLRIDWVPC